MDVVRLADRGDARTLAALQLEAALAGYAHIFPAEAEPPTLDQLLAAWQDCLGPGWQQGRRVFVAELDASAIGVVLAGPDPADSTLGHVARLYVRPDRWGAGTGSALYFRAVAHLREMGFSEATLWVLEHNVRARSWYERLGWQTTGERKPVYEPAQIDDVRYRINLADGQATSVPSGR